MDGLDGTSFDNNGTSTVSLGSDLGPLGDAASPSAQASWDQAAADAGLDGEGTDTWGNPISGASDVTDAATASALSQDSTASQPAEQPAQGNASGALPAAAVGGTVGAATMDGAAAGGSGLLAELGLGGLVRTAAGLLGSGLAAPVAGALALFWPSSTASNDTAPPGGWTTQPQTALGGGDAPTLRDDIVESNPGNGNATPHLPSSAPQARPDRQLGRTIRRATMAPGKAGRAIIRTGRRSQTLNGRRTRHTRMPPTMAAQRRPGRAA